MNLSMPAPAPVQPLRFDIGRDRRGHWVVVETHRTCGGLFSSEAAARRYVREESGCRDEAIRLVDHPLEFGP